MARFSFAKLLLAAAVGATVTALSAGPAKAAAMTTTCGIAADLLVGDKTISNIICRGVGAATEIRFDTAGLVETLEKPPHSRDNGLVIAGKGWVHGRQAAGVR